MLAVARQRTANRLVEFFQHSLPDPFPFADDAFDLIVSGLVVEHVVDLEAVLRECVRVLKPSGRCLVTALHPDRTATGQRARFIDPLTGLRTPIATIHRTESEYLAAAKAAGFHVEESRTLIGTEELTATSPRAVKYIGLPLGWMGVFVKPIV
jgi:malonyl-CoA O-methyltransferase